MKRALERYEVGAVRVIYVLLRPVDWSGLPIDSVGFLPADGNPISLWRDKDLAFQEVARGIRKVVDELTERVAAPFIREPKTPLWTVPYRRNLYFTGREELLALLHTYFSPTHSLHTRIQALNGLAGIGKTQIAIEYAYRYQQEYQAVLWVRGSSLDVFCADLLALANLLSLPEKELGSESQLFAAIRRYLQYHEQWLLLIDDLDVFHLVDSLVPPHCKGHVLLTTRIQAKGTSIHALPVPPMTFDESALFLLRRAKIIEEQATLTAALPAEYIQALAVVREVDRFPLALDQAGAYIEETGRSLNDYLTLYQQHRPQLLQRRGYFFDSHPQSVSATLTLTFEQVAQVNPVAMDVLRLFAFLHPDAISDEMIVDGAAFLDEPLRSLAVDPLALDTAIATLLDFSLVLRRADTTTLGIHRIVQAVLRDLSFLTQPQHWALLVVRLVYAIFPRPDFSSWPLCQRYLPHAQLCATYIIEFKFVELPAAQLLLYLGRYCSQRALYTEANTYLPLALDLYEQVLGPQSLEVAETLAALASLFFRLGDNLQVESLYTRALVLYEQLLGPEHPETAILLNNLALLYQEQGRYLEAESHYQRVLAIYHQVYGQQHLEIATTLNNLALLYQKLGQYQRAEEFFQQALAQREILLEPGDPAFAQSWNNLATIYQDQEKYQEAEPFLLRSLDLFEQTVGPEHPDTAVCMNNLAELYCSLAKYQQAEELHLRALAINERFLGSEHPDTALTLSNLGRLYRIRGNYQQAETFYLQALSIYEQTLGSEHPDTALLLNNLGKLYLLLGNYQQATSLLLRAIAIAEQVFGPDHPDTLWYLRNLAELYTLQERYQDAESLYQRILATCQKNSGQAQHPDVALVLEKYAHLREKMQKRVEDATLFHLPTQPAEEQGY